MNPYRSPESGKPEYQKPRVEIDWHDFFIVLFIMLSFPIVYGFLLDSEIVRFILYLLKNFV